ncbi:unnamed protein product [Brachionus calyciflorus]|uniref:Nuclear pore complex protein Nup160 n=1 Tax=Brachionus calyciflorus TaxID=104777 RepID=A0A813QQZ4_9BILA|nr:unnamed protein product [Brachionus calyciflorus]
MKIDQRTDIYIESSTLHDEDFLSCHEIFTTTKTIDSSLETSGTSSKAHNCAGGFSLNLKNDNRFILWKIIGNKLELIEHSLTHKLTGNFKRIHFKDAMIIPKIHLYKHAESDTNSSNFNVIVLVVTSSRLYRLIFKYNKNENNSNSLFSSMSSMTLSNVESSNTYQINLSQVESTDIFVNQRGETYFAFVLPNNSICCVQMPGFSRINHQQNNSQNLPVKFEINQPNIVKRLWSGITRNSQDTSSGFVSFKFFSHNDNPYFVCLCRDFKLKLWCIKTNQCIYVEELSKFFKSDLNIIWNESKIDAISFNDTSILTVVFSTSDQFKLSNLKIVISNSNEVTINEVSKRTLVKTGELVSIQCTNFNTWIMYKNDKEQVEMTSVPIYENKHQTNLKLPNEIQIVNPRKLIDSNRVHNNFNEDFDEEQFNEDEFEEEKINEQILSEMDLKELYLKKIFEPSRYSRHNMLKSLSILGAHSHDFTNVHLTSDEIKEKIIKSIETAVQSHPNYSNISEDEFLSLNMKFWSKYYTMLKQYDFDSRQPIGFFIEPQNESIILLIRKNSVSLYNKADLSQFYHYSQIEYLKSYLLSNLKLDDNELNDLLNVIIALKCIDSNLKTHPNLNCLSHLKELDSTTCYQYVNNLTDYLTMSQKDFFGKFSPYFEKMNNLDRLDQILQKLFDLFNVNKTNEIKYRYGHHESELDDQDDEYDDEDGMDTDGMTSFLKITSDFTNDSIVYSMRDLFLKRFDFFRNLSVFVNVVFKYSNKIDISNTNANNINQLYFEQSIKNMASYLYLKWLADIYPYAIQSEHIVRHLRRTANILEDFKGDQINYTKEGNHLLLKTFLSTFNKFSIQTQSNYLEISNYSQLNEYISSKIVKFIWPLNLEENINLIKYLFFNIQYIHLINYCLTTKWIQNSKNLRSFIMGHCCLYLNNIDQSIGFFLRASYNLEKDVYLKILMKLGSNQQDTNKNPIQFKTSRRSIIINNKSNVTNKTSLSIDLIDNNDNAILLDFYTKIIHYYDLNGNLEAAIELIQNALLKCQFDSKSKSKLYCILFKSYMDLEYFDKAYISLMSNTDIEWKKICLKNFISELCNQNKTDVLVGFDYGDLLNEVFNILMSRAKTSDLRNNDFYRVLFTLYVKIKDYRKAAYSMYECYMRLKREVNGINSLKRQEKCLLACLNMLKLVENKFAWINITDLSQYYTESIQDETASKIKIIDLDEINRNYLLVNYTLKVSQNQNMISNQHTIEELISLLTKNGYYDDALNLCLNVKRSDHSIVLNVLLSLVDRCCNVNVVENDDKLADDVLTEIEMIKKNESLKPSISPYENPYSFKWKLLESYLDKLNDSIYYKNVCQRILILGYEIPATVQYKFKLLNPQSLLSIYLNYGLWNEALNLIKELINQSPKDFVTSNKQSDIVLPFNLIDTLNKYCQIQPSEQTEDLSEMKKINSELNELMNDYIYQVKLSTESYVNLKRKN